MTERKIGRLERDLEEANRSAANEQDAPYTADELYETVIQERDEAVRERDDEIMLRFAWEQERDVLREENARLRKELDQAYKQLVALRLRLAMSQRTLGFYQSEVERRKAAFRNDDGEADGYA